MGLLSQWLYILYLDTVSFQGAVSENDPTTCGDAGCCCEPPPAATEPFPKFQTRLFKKNTKRYKTFYFEWPPAFVKYRQEKIKQTYTNIIYKYSLRVPCSGACFASLFCMHSTCAQCLANIPEMPRVAGASGLFFFYFLSGKVWAQHWQLLRAGGWVGITMDGGGALWRMLARAPSPLNHMICWSEAVNNKRHHYAVVAQTAVQGTALEPYGSGCGGEQFPGQESFWAPCESEQQLKSGRILHQVLVSRKTEVRFHAKAAGAVLLVPSTFPHYRDWNGPGEKEWWQKWDACPGVPRIHQRRDFAAGWNACRRRWWGFSTVQVFWHWVAGVRGIGCGCWWLHHQDQLSLRQWWASMLAYRVHQPHDQSSLIQRDSVANSRRQWCQGFGRAGFHHCSADSKVRGQDEILGTLVLFRSDFAFAWFWRGWL